jgi:large subunit ribosomal protein L24
MAKFRIKRDDTVLVIAGKHKGTRGRVLRVMPDEGRLVVEGVNRVKRHQKPVGDQPGSIIEKEAPIAVSNVALWDEKNGRRVKVAIRKSEDGKRVRVDRKSGASLDNG